ncbi:FRG domain-containing protein [bacterium]|nr:FRG domain-containing protein [bacterium]
MCRMLQRITSVADALDQIRNLDWIADSDSGDRPNPYGGYWYRGEAKQYASKLIPKAFRRAAQGHENYHLAFYKGQSSLLYFQNEFMHELPTGSSSLDWLCYSQHHALPTRLVDFTRNLLIALYFATEIDAHEPSDGSLYVLSPVRLNETSVFQRCVFGSKEFSANLRAEMSRNYSLIYLISELSKRYSEQYMREYLLRLIDCFREDNLSTNLPSRGSFECILRQFRSTDDVSLPFLLSPVAFFPRISNERLRRQSAAFVIFGGGGIDNVYFDPITLYDFNIQHNFYVEFIIERNHKQNIRNELEMMGIHLGSIFPEPEYTAQNIASNLSYN